MPVDYEYDPERHLLRTRFWGEVTGDDLRRQASAVARDRRITPPIRELVDLTEVTGGHIEEQTLYDVASGDRKLAGKYAGLRIAIVAVTETARAAAERFGKVSKAVGAASLIRIFDDADEAEKWLFEDD